VIKKRSSAERRMNFLISIQNVDVKLQGHRILTDISWKLKPGEHWAFIGINGSGRGTENPHSEGAG